MRSLWVVGQRGVFCVDKKEVWQAGKSESGGRPERKFESRRMLFALGIFAIILFLCVWGVVSIASPGRNLGAVVASAAGATGTPLVRVVALPSATGTLVAVERIDCRVLVDFTVGGTLYPVRSMVLVDGYTFAFGGRVRLASGAWIDSGLVACGAGLERLERPYSISPSPSPSPSLTATKVRERRTLSPMPSLTPSPTPSSTPSSSMITRAGDCWTFAVSGVREIFVDGRGIVGGATLCGIREFRVVVQ